MEILKNKKELLLAIVATILITIPTLFAQFEYALDPSFMHEEQSQLFADHKIKDSELFPENYLADYKAKFQSPLLFDYIYKSMMEHFDIYYFHKIFPMIIWVLMIFFMGLSAYKIGGLFSMWSSTVITISHSMFLYQITSSIPHSFGYLLVIMAVTCILYARIYLLSIVGILSALLYPGVSPVIGLSMAYFLLITDKAHRGKAKDWSIYKRFILLGITAAIMLLAIYPVMSPIDGYGRSIAPFTETEEFPENSKDSSNFIGSAHPIVYVIAKLYVQFDISNEFKTLLGMGCILAIIVISIRGWYFFKDDKRIKSRFNAFIFSSIVSFILVYFLMPIYVYRFIIYTFPIFYVLVFPMALHKIIKNDKKLDKEYHSLVSVAIIIVLLVLFKGKDPVKIGYMIETTDVDKKFFSYVSKLPKDVLISSWPNTLGYNDWIPYLGKRNVLMMKKFHQIRYYDYGKEMQKRMNATIEAFIGGDIEKIRYLKTEFGVDYLVIDMNMYGEEMPQYNNHFNKRIEELWIQNKKDNNIEILKHLDKAVYHDDNIYIIDINDI